MSKVCLVAALLLPCACFSSWYWPFGDDDDSAEPRISELIELASELIDSASEYASDGEIDKAVDKYRQALAELDRVELENPDRVDKPDFATLKNKRAIANAAIDSLLLQQARANAKSVRITDTTSLEAEYAELKRKQREAKSGKPAPSDDATRVVAEAESAPAAKPAAGRTPAASPAPAAAASPGAANEAKKGGAAAPSRRLRLQAAIAKLNAGDSAGARATVDELLAEHANYAAALNLRARIEMYEGKLDEAEKTLKQCIISNPRSHYAYYNMARVLLRARGEGEEGRKSALRYYRHGRKIGGPRVADLEKLEEHSGQ